MGWEVSGDASSRVRNVQQLHIDGWDRNNKFALMSLISDQGEKLGICFHSEDEGLINNNLFQALMNIVVRVTPENVMKGPKVVHIVYKCPKFTQITKKDFTRLKGDFIINIKYQSGNPIKVNLFLLF